MEDVFFLEYHLHQQRTTILQMPINERKWMVERFVQQRNRENEQVEASRRRKK